MTLFKQVVKYWSGVSLEGIITSNMIGIKATFYLTLLAVFVVEFDVFSTI